MDKQMTLEWKYLSKKKEYEEREAELLEQRDKAISDLENIEEKCVYYLKNKVPDKTMLIAGYRHMDHLKEEVLEMTNNHLDDLSSKKEELETNFHYQLRQCNDT